MQGYLEKQTSSVLFRKFQQRYFVQRRSSLLYYLRREDADESVSEPKGQIDLNQCIATGLTEGDESAREFWIEMPERTYWFRAPNTAERDCWIANLIVFNGCSALDALPIARHVYMALTTALTSLTGPSGDVEGLFRVPGVKNVVDRTCDAIYRLQIAEAFAASDVTVFELASVVKKLLRELPESILTQDLILPFTSMSATADSIRDLMEKLPLQNRDILMKLSVLLHRQLQNNAVTKASSKSLSILLGPCLSMNMDAPFLDVTKLISVLVEQGSIVFGYSFSRAIALSVSAPEPPALSTTQQNPWVNQQLEKETISEKKAVAHLTEIEHISDAVVEVEHFVPVQMQQRDGSAQNTSDDEATETKHVQQPTVAPSANHRSASVIQTQFNAQEFGLSSGSEMTPREDDVTSDSRLPQRMMDAVNQPTGNSSPSKSIVRLQPIRRGRRSVAVQRKDILSMGNTSESDNDTPHSKGLSSRLRRLSVPQGRVRNSSEVASNHSARLQTSESSKSKLLLKSESISKSDTVVVNENPSTGVNGIIAAEGCSVDPEQADEDSLQLSCGSSLVASNRKAPFKQPSTGSNTRATRNNSSNRSSVSADPVLNLENSNDKDTQPSVNIPARSRTASPNSSKLSDFPQAVLPAGELELPSPIQNAIVSHSNGESEIVNGAYLNSLEAELEFFSKSMTNDKSFHSRNDKLASELPDFGEDQPAVRSGSANSSSANFQNAGDPAVNTKLNFSEESFKQCPEYLGEKQAVSNYRTGKASFSPEKKRAATAKNYELTANHSSSYRRSVISASTQTDHTLMKDSAVQAAKANRENSIKDQLETTQRQLTDYKERLSHYQRKCNSLEEAIQSQTQATDLLHKHSLSLQTKNRSLFQEQESLNNELEEALLQLEQTRQQLRLQLATNVNLTNAINQQKSQHEATVAALEMQNHALLAQQTTSVRAGTSLRAHDHSVADVAGKNAEMNVMLKKRLEMMRSRVQSRLHNSRENLASIESRAIFGMAESKIRIQKLQMELNGLHNPPEIV